MSISGETLKKIKVPENIIAFYQEMIAIQKKYRPLLKMDLEKVDLVSELAQGQSIISLGKLEYDMEEVNTLLVEIIDVVKKHRPELSGELKELEDALDSFSLQSLKELIDNFLLQKNYPQELDKIACSKQLITFIFMNSLKPFVKILAKGLQDLESLKIWKNGYCPICGWKPLLGKITEGQQRVLHCSFCDHEWAFKALKCAECGNENHENLQYFTLPVEEGREVHVCNNCKTYLKVINTKEAIVDKDIELEDIKTIYLDLLAQNEGFQRS